MRRRQHQSILCLLCEDSEKMTVCKPGSRSSLGINSATTLVSDLL